MREKKMGRERGNSTIGRENQLSFVLFSVNNELALKSNSKLSRGKRATAGLYPATKSSTINVSKPQSINSSRFNHG